MSERLKELRVDLEFPVEHKGETVDHLVLRRITARDSITIDKVSTEMQGIAMIALIARVPVGVIESLDVDDWEEVQRKALPFMPKSMRRLYEKAFEAQDKALDSIDKIDVSALMATMTNLGSAPASEK